MFQSAGILQSLSKRVQQRNDENKPIIDAQLTSLGNGLLRALATFDSLAKYKEDHASQVSALASLPLATSQVDALKAQVKEGAPNSKA